MMWSRLRMTASAGLALLAVTAALLFGPGRPAFAAGLYSRCYNGAVYAVRPSDGALMWWGDAAPATVGGFTASRQVGSAWNGLTNITAGGGGTIYGVTGTGELRWYRHTDPVGGAGTWAPGSGKVIGPSGWDQFSTLISGGSGVLYGINASTGELKWYRYTDPVGGNGTWASGSGNVVGTNWAQFPHVFSGGAGIVYAVRSDGQLIWYRQGDPYTGTGGWSANPIGVGWSGFTGFLPEGGGVIYGIRTSGALGFYRHTDPYSGRATWVTGGDYGSDWQNYRKVTSDPSACGTTDQSSVSFVKTLSRGWLAQFSWSDDQFPCLDSLWIRESDWRWNAENPSSHAYGIPQSLPASKMSSAGPDWESNPLTQVGWGLSYIDDRYRSPCAAWAHEQADGWY